MPKKKKPRSAKQVKDLSRSEEVAHYLSILAENMQSEFKMVSEKADSTEERLIQRMDEKFAEQNVRFERIELVLGKHSGKLNEQGMVLNTHTEILNEHGKILNEHGKVLNEHGKVLNEHGKILNGLTKTLNEHGCILQRIETKLDGLTEKVESHDGAIKEIQAQLP